MNITNGIVKFLLGLLLGVSVAALTTLNVLLAWVATGPRSLDVLTPYIEMSFEPPDHKYSVSIGETWLIWDGWKHPIDIRLKDVKVLTSERRTYSKFPEISLGLDLLALLQGKILPTSLTISHPVISLFQKEDLSLSFGSLAIEPEAENAPAEVTPETPPETPVVPFAAVMAPFIAPDDNSPLRKLRLVSIVNADVSINNKRRGVFFKANGADITFKHSHEGMQAFASAKIAYDNYLSQITLHVNKKKDNPQIKGDIAINQLMPGALADMFAENTLLSGMKVPVSGTSSFTLDANGAFEHIQFNIDGGKGTLESDRLAGPLPVTTLHVEGGLDDNLNLVTISKLNADLDGMVIGASGKASIRDKETTSVEADIAASNIGTQSLRLLWPPQLAPVSREWVTANILEGTVPQAKAHIAIAAGDLAKSQLPKEDVDAVIQLEGAKIRYLPEHPEVTDVKGSIHIDGLSLDAALESAHYMKDTKLSEGRVLIEDLNPDNPYIKITLTAESSAKDAVHFLELPPLKHAQRLNLQADAAEGTLKGHAFLGFKFFAPRDEKGKPIGSPDVDYDVAVEMKNIVQPGFMKKFDIKNADGTLTVNNEKLEYKGSGMINGASATDADITYLFKPDKGFDTFIEATANAPVDVLPRFGYPAFPFLKGSLGVKANVKQGKDIEISQASIDLTHAAVTWTDLGINKPDGEAATLDITGEKKEDIANIPNFRFKSKSIDAHGEAELTRDMSGIRKVSMDKVISGKTNLDNLVYEHEGNAISLSMNGNSMDMTPWFGVDDKSTEGTFSFEHFPALQLKTDVAHVYFGEGRELSLVKGSVNCDATHCESANINGVTVDKKPFNFRIMRNPKGKRQLSLHVQSAGAFLRAVNVFDGMEGGDLTITGNYNETDKGGSVLRGRADITDHTVKDAPVLAKIVSLASLTGIFDTLQGKGIHFDRLSAPFTISNDVLTLKNAKTHGDAIGMTAQGTVTFPKGTLDIEGTLVPSYNINHVLGNVPILGKVLTGGEGQGVFAARYSVKGTQKEPDVSVNPLSILTPGFLRGLFDIFDGPDKKEDAEE